MAARAVRAARAFSSHRASSPLSSPAAARASQTARSRSRATVLAASRAQAGTPPRLPMAPGAAATSASRWARSRPAHQACTASGAAPAGGAAASAASAGSARPRSCSRTCSALSTPVRAAHTASSSAARSARQRSSSASKPRTVAACSWLLDQGGDQLRGHAVGPQHQGGGPVDEVPSLLKQPGAVEQPASSSACRSTRWPTARRASDIASAVVPRRRIASSYADDPRPSQPPTRAPVATKPPRSSIWAEAARRSTAKSRTRAGSATSGGTGGGPGGGRTRSITAQRPCHIQDCRRSCRSPAASSVTR